MDDVGILLQTIGSPSGVMTHGGACFMAAIEKSRQGETRGFVHCEGSRLRLTGGLREMYRRAKGRAR